MKIIINTTFCLSMLLSGCAELNETNLGMYKTAERCQEQSSKCTHSATASWSNIF